MLPSYHAFLRQSSWKNWKDGFPELGPVARGKLIDTYKEDPMEAWKRACKEFSEYKAALEKKKLVTDSRIVREIHHKVNATQKESQQTSVKENKYKEDDKNEGGTHSVNSVCVRSRTENSITAATPHEMDCKESKENDIPSWDDGVVALVEYLQRHVAQTNKDMEAVNDCIMALVPKGTVRFPSEFSHSVWPEEAIDTQTCVMLLDRSVACVKSLIGDGILLTVLWEVSEVKRSGKQPSGIVIRLRYRGSDFYTNKWIIEQYMRQMIEYGKNESE